MNRSSQLLFEVMCVFIAIHWIRVCRDLSVKQETLCQTYINPKQVRRTMFAVTDFFHVVERPGGGCCILEKTETIRKKIEDLTLSGIS